MISIYVHSSDLFLRREILKNVCDTFSEFSVFATMSGDLIASGYTVASVVCGVKVRDREIMYYIDDGMYGSFHESLFDPISRRALAPMPLSVETGARLVYSTIWGPTCDSLDCIGERVLLPAMAVNDWVYFKNCGGFATRTVFNGIEEPSVHYKVD